MRITSYPNEEHNALHKIYSKPSTDRKKKNKESLKVFALGLNKRIYQM